MTRKMQIGVDSSVRSLEQSALSPAQKNPQKKPNEQLFGHITLAMIQAHKHACVISKGI